jgi:Ca-activated chloride channel family protein
MVANYSGLAKLLVPTIGIPVLFFAYAWIVYGQESCVSPQRIAALREEIVSTSTFQPNEKLKAEVLQLKAVDSESPPTSKKKKDSREEAASPQDKNSQQKVTERLCSILNLNSWPLKSIVGPEAASLWINLVRTQLSLPFQRDLVPVISAGVDKNEIDKDFELAALIDRLRIAAGAPQLFGTQAAAKDGFLILWPLESEEKVDTFRFDYHMGRLRDQIRGMEEKYKMTLIRSTARASRVAVAKEQSPGEQGSQQTSGAQEDNQVTRVDTSLVTIDAVIYGPAAGKLEKTDFRVFENNQEQEIHDFGTADLPSDIVLLLDLSGSTADKVGLIRKTTRQFVDMKRDVDRIAVITFAGRQNTVSPLEADKAKLLDRIGKLKDSGESNVWDSIKYAMDLLKRDSTDGRRKAVVVMTDGVDNSLSYEPGFGSNTLFSELLENVRNNSIAIFPVYLDTEERDPISSRMYADARRTLQLLADDSGGVYYAAKDVSNLSEIYERVLKDLGRVYSLGYEPKNSARDGTWRTIRVEIPGHPEIKVRARSGYYAK